VLWLLHRSYVWPKCAEGITAGYCRDRTAAQRVYLSDCRLYVILYNQLLIAPVVFCVVTEELLEAMACPAAVAMFS
jgi:hypothetical protein